MAVDPRMQEWMESFRRTSYGRWIEKEGLPCYEGHGIEDVRELALAPWARTGGDAAFINLYGMEGVTAMHVGEIPPGGALKPECHLYEEVICVLQGNGATEVWREGEEKHLFEWGQWSVFSPPLNCWHRLVNGSREPVKFLAVTTAPLMMDIFHNEEFIFNCPYSFADRFSGERDYFAVGTKRYKMSISNIWETNFIANVKDVAIEEQETKGSGVRITQFEMSGNALIGHVAKWPVGRYHKAHYHGPGAVILILRSEGYVLIWPKEASTQPYRAGREDEVVEMKWGEGSIYTPPGGWFHQHFNVGQEPAQQLAIRYGSRLYPIGFKTAAKRKEDGTLTDIKKGGTVIEYEDEDPEIRRRYEMGLKQAGVSCEMPPVRGAA